MQPGSTAARSAVPPIPAVPSVPSVPAVPSRSDLAAPEEGPLAVQLVLAAAVRAVADLWPRRVVVRTGARPPAQPRSPRAHLWCIAREASLGLRDLGHVIGAVARAVAPGFTVSVVRDEVAGATDGHRVDVRLRGTWVEIGRAGLVPPAHLRALVRGGEGVAGGIVLALDLERLVMLAKGIDDATLLHSDEPGVAEQMADLEPYVPPRLRRPAPRRQEAAASTRSMAPRSASSIAAG